MTDYSPSYISIQFVTRLAVPVLDGVSLWIEGPSQAAEYLNFTTFAKTLRLMSEPIRLAATLPSFGMYVSIGLVRPLSSYALSPPFPHQHPGPPTPSTPPCETRTFLSPIHWVCIDTTTHHCARDQSTMNARTHAHLPYCTQRERRLRRTQRYGDHETGTVRLDPLAVTRAPWRRQRGRSPRRDVHICRELSFKMPTRSGSGALTRVSQRVDVGGVGVACYAGLSVLR